MFNDEFIGANVKMNYVILVTAGHLKRLSEQLGAKKPSCIKDFNRYFK